MPKNRTQHKAPPRISVARAYVNTLAPTHERTSCSEAAEKDGGPRIEQVTMNARFSDSDFGGCYRCTLMRVMVDALEGKLAPEEDDEE
jgi:hypothetical protein